MNNFNFEFEPLTDGQPEVTSAPQFPLPMDTDLDQFFNSFVLEPLHQMSMQQPPQHPAIDSLVEVPVPVQQHQQQVIVLDDDLQKPGQLYPPFSTAGYDQAKQVIKEEKMSGFLDTWTQQSVEQPATCDDSSYLASFPTSPDEHKRMESSLIKEELSCRLQLKMLKEGKDYSTEADASSGQANRPISEETRELQRARREKNREAAKKCRMKKKQSERLQEEKLRKAEKEVQELRKQLDAERSNYAKLLNQFKGFPCFMAYLKQNRDALKSPYLKSALQGYARGQHSFDNVGQIKACTAGSSVSGLVANQCATGFSIEQ